MFFTVHFAQTVPHLCTNMTMIILVIVVNLVNSADWLYIWLHSKILNVISLYNSSFMKRNI